MFSLSLFLAPPTIKMAAPLLEKLSVFLGSPEPAVRLILSILIGEFRLVIRRSVLAGGAAAVEPRGGSGSYLPPVQVSVG